MYIKHFANQGVMDLMTQLKEIWVLNGYHWMCFDSGTILVYMGNDSLVIGG